MQQNHTKHWNYDTAIVSPRITALTTDPNITVLAEVISADLLTLICVYVIRESKNHWST